jgi:CPA2 family monovalent cation:H+ antiporter-2
MREDDWGVDLVEVTIPEGVPYAGRTLRALGIRSRMGCTVVEIERQGVEIANPHPDQALYPGDRVLLVGGEAETAATRAFLEGMGVADDHSFRENTLETVLVPEGSPHLGKTLAELRIFTQTGVQILGIRRGGRTMLNPAAGEGFEAGDALLILATPEEGADFERWLLG